ncbi:Os08g0149566 [Oryza sativa Japonica Group]|uniref:Os08g0149566 protein n=1 Tax=Oryza sativa subsp. japonica TaxID=39947 RepID=A0A0P0XBP5_ORYSJ|nr:Os08g0149566 [Oryza sativa Japonica Group]
MHQYWSSKPLHCKHPAMLINHACLLFRVKNPTRLCCAIVLGKTSRYFHTTAMEMISSKRVPYAIRNVTMTSLWL